MELLTGKCKEDFLEYYWKNYFGKTRYINEKENTEDFFDSLIEPLKGTLIVEFFDREGIYISAVPVFKSPKEALYGFSFSVNLVSDYTFFKDRIEATESAIKKANEIYNERGA